MALQEYFNTGDNASQVMVNSTRWCSQGFLAASSYNIGSVKIKIYKLGTPGTITVSIRDADSSYEPTGGDLASGTTGGDSLTEDSGGEWREITFVSPYSLSSGSKYAIVVRTGWTPPPAGAIYWRGDSSENYINGEGFLSFDSGGAWSAVTIDDFMFENHGSATVPSKPINPTPTNTSTTVTLDQATLTWEDGGGADTYNVYFGPSGNMVLQSSTQAGLSWDIDILPFSYNVAYQWRIDATNTSGTTTGDTWSFTTIVFAPPTTSTGKWQIIKRLVVAAKNKFWYEDI